MTLWTNLQRERGRGRLHRAAVGLGAAADEERLLERHGALVGDDLELAALLRLRNQIPFSRMSGIVMRNGLGLPLYDKLHGTRSHRVYENWLEYWKANYRGLGPDGRVEWVTAYSDPSVNFNLKSNNVATGVATAFYMAPQNREVAASIYQAAARAESGGRRAPPAGLSIAALVMARELDGQAGMQRLGAAAERDYEPRFFGDDSSRFGWWFKLAEQYRRGQRSSLMMVTDVGKPGDWIRAFQVPHLDKFLAPTCKASTTSRLASPRPGTTSSEGG